MAEQYEEKYIPGSDAESSDIFKFPYTVDDNSINFIKKHGRIMFIIRGPRAGKDSLTSMLVDCYETAFICSADTYFNNMFSKSKRDSGSLMRSHKYCQEKVQNACIKGTHPIIVKNTHMKKAEVQKYVDFAAEYNYTIIMAITTQKMQILAQSNTKGLSVEYFRRRLKQWQDFIPVNTGWFLNADDSSLLLKQVQLNLISLLGDGKFCSHFNAFIKGHLEGHFKARKLLYCVAACGKNNRSEEIQSYYLSNNVKEHYGQCFPIVIQGYIVTFSYIAAVVHLNETMKNLLFIENNRSLEEDDIESVANLLGSLTLNENFLKCSSTKKFDYAFESFEDTVEWVEEKDREVININNCGFMILAQNDCKIVLPNEVINIFFKLLNRKADTHGEIGWDNFHFLDNFFSYCRLADDAWLIRPPSDLSFETVFTGLYV
ncbi:2',3'-cyclic-nucleotide 3'-phosphodiesterase [Caerostris extrusa]|uniref:2',3'-cyclic-nucleotide 3'-phosphodiesterase n=1 Tax=Caerostris extrusa TaxID=172846 RepID=A0AAV4WGI0_CAEEX|nr:2',3'-cyclic-nucleotide 3'-phosphodiesterase [Caerostris extrusa]